MTSSPQKAMALNRDHAGERLQRCRSIPDKRILSSLNHGNDVDLIPCPRHSASVRTASNRSL